MANEALDFIFDNYDEDHDGQLQQKDFFLFVYELKHTARQEINQDQMIKCWEHCDVEGKGYLTKEEFSSRVEVLYENSFFGKQRSLASSSIGSAEKLTDPNYKPFDQTAHQFGTQFPQDVYNTVRFKNSPAVKAMEELLKDEKTSSPIKPPIKKEPSNLVYTPRDRSSVTSSASSNSLRTRTDPIQRTASSNIRPGSGQVGIFSAGQESAAKKKEDAQKKMEEILAQKYQEERRAREEQRKKKEEEEKMQRVSESNASVAAPKWMQDLKTRKSSGSLQIVA